MKAYDQALFSAGHQLVVIYFSNSSESDLLSLREEFPQHRFFSANINKAVEVAERVNLRSSRAFKFFVNGTEIESIEFNRGDGCEMVKEAL